MRFRLTLEYDGSNYSGWQLQHGQDSIQGRVEAALAALFGEKIRVYAAGRTDAGVHALGQVIAFDAPRELPPSELQNALNALMPRDIAVCETLCTSADFDPRRDAKSRCYEYRVLNRTTRSAFAFRYAWLVRQPLDLDAMNRAASCFIGEHDFAAFRTLGSGETTTTRRIFVSEWRRTSSDWLIYRVEATAFLRHMVRAMVAVMVEAGRGKLPPENVAAILQTGVRSGGAAPPGGLFLTAVHY